MKDEKPDVRRYELVKFPKPVEIWPIDRECLEFVEQMNRQFEKLFGELLLPSSFGISGDETAYNACSTHNDWSTHKFPSSLDEIMTIFRELKREIAEKREKRGVVDCFVVMRDDYEQLRNQLEQRTIGPPPPMSFDIGLRVDGVPIYPAETRADYVGMVQELIDEGKRVGVINPPVEMKKEQSNV